MYTWENELGTLCYGKNQSPEMVENELYEKDEPQRKRHVPLQDRDTRYSVE
jgi:hypothetical protein